MRRDATALYVISALTAFYVGIFIAHFWLVLSAALVLYHASHELMHDSIFRSRRLNRLAGCLTQACCLHNYYILRAAHSAHHRCGREDRTHCLIDHKHFSYGSIEIVYYYSYLAGLNFYLYVMGGFLYTISPSHFRRHFFFVRYGGTLAILAQTLVVINFGLLWYSLDYAAFAIIGLLAAYWGLSQNVAHYALQKGGDRARFASRTFRVAPFWDFMFFGSVFRHLEHHVLPHVSASRLGSPEVREAVTRAIGGEPIIEVGIGRYFIAMFDQLGGPQPVIRPWKR